MLQKERLTNGIRIVTEEINYVNSVSIGIWVKTGSRNETELNNGVSHFIEHMLFKGTANRSAKQIASSIDNIGGQLNAFTSKECTCFYAKVLDSHFDIALDVLSDMFHNSNFSNEDIEKEKGVVMEEIGMYEDTPEDLVHDLFSQIVWSGNPLGMSILGTEKSLMGLSRESIISYFENNYIPDNIVISVVGNFKHPEIVEKIKRSFEKRPIGYNNPAEVIRPDFSPQYAIKNKETEQIHLCIGFNGIETTSKAYYPMLVMNNIFGGAMSSRLFQKIREDMGLAYSVFSYPSSFQDCGLFSVYAGMKPAQLQKVSELIMEEVHLLRKNGITQEELYNSKEQLKGSYILGLESTSGRMISIGKSELLLNRVYTPAEIIEKVDNVNFDQVNEAIETIFDIDNMGGAVIGAVDKKLDLKELLK